MKKNKITFIMILFFFIGLLVLLYPSISNYYNEKSQSKAIVDYETIIKKYEKEEYQNYFKEANEYNKQLSSLSHPLIKYKKLKNYHKILNFNQIGMMGYLTISKIKVELPIYHGTSEDVLSTSVGHLEGTSLPIGGQGTHSVLSAHRGLPSSKLFTDVDKLEVGDTFTITILDSLLTYEVDKIVIVDPNDTSYLKIDKEKDYVTLLTCTPYGINTHRLLIRGKRIENIDEKKNYVTTEAFRISNLISMPLVALPIIFILLIIIMVTPVKKNKKSYEKYIYPSGKKTNGGNYEKNKEFNYNRTNSNDKYH